jgi:hypothetical protein
MVIQELSNEGTANFFLQNPFSTKIIHYLSIVLVNILSYAYICAKFYKVMCYSKMTFEWLPMVNPYYWPFSVFTVSTSPYFQFWQTFFPSIKFQKSSVDVSAIIALEVLNSVIYVFVRITQIFLSLLETTEKLI